MVFRPHLETAKFAPNSAVAFFAACWRAKTGGLCHLHIPCRRRGASASRQRTLCSTRSGWHAALSLTPWRGHCNTHRSSLRLTLVAVFAQVRENVTAENGLTGPSRSPGAPRPSPPTFAAWPTPLMPMRRTSRTDLVAVAPAGRCCRGAAERRDGCGFNDEGAPARLPPLRATPPASLLPGLLRTLAFAHSGPLPCVNSALVLPVAWTAARSCVP